jgi:hypothetical protein
MLDCAEVVAGHFMESVRRRQPKVTASSPTSSWADGSIPRSSATISKGRRSSSSFEVVLDGNVTAVGSRESQEDRRTQPNRPRL